MAFCNSCGTEIQEGFEFCPECGQAVSSIMMSMYAEKAITCRNCGEQMPEDAFYCLRCGMTFDSYETEFEEVKRRVLDTRKPQQAVDTSVGVWKNKWISLILCVFLGIFGIHRFYEEKKISGFIYLFTIGVFGLGWFFDIILLATKRNPYRVK